LLIIRNEEVETPYAVTFPQSEETPVGHTVSRAHERASGLVIQATAFANSLRNEVLEYAAGLSPHWI
jgi:hypothetical protein